MDRSVIGLFDSVSEAQRALNELVQAGFSRDHISLVANDVSGSYSKYLNKDANFDPEGDVTADEGAGFGAAVGAITGVLASLGALAIPGIGPVIAAGPLLAAVTGGTIGAVAGAATGGLTASLIKTGLPEDEAQYYTEGVRRGGTLLVVDTDSDSKAQQAVQIMDRNGAVDVNQRASEWKQSGWKYSDNAKPYTADQVNSFTSKRTDMSSTPSSTTNKQTSKTQEGKQVLPVVEEKLDVSKREVERGGVRVNTRIVEKPVSEQVTLHEEHVNVERRPVDRPVNASDMTAFKEGTIEMRETAEEAVVNKQARVIEEIVIEKHAHDRTQTINDTVRRTEVDVQNLSGQQTSSAQSGSSFDSYANDFRTHFNSKYGSKGGYSYDQYSPAYRYGYNLASNQNYSGDWSSYESDIRNRWEERNQGTWEDFKDAIRYAWDKVRGKPASTAR